MKPEENYLDDLFQSARSEEPQLSYEEVADSFLSNTFPTLATLAKNWFLRNISLNSIFLFVIGVVTVGFIWSSFSEKSNIEAKKISTAVTIESPKSSISKKGNSILESEKMIEKIVSKPELKNEIQITENNLAKKPQPNFSKKEQPTSIKIAVEDSPKIEFISSVKIETPQAPELKIKLKKQADKIDNNTFAKELNSESQPSQPQQMEVTGFSPWVVGDGNSHPDWTIVQQQPHKYFLGENELILQKMFDLNYLEKIFEKSDNENFAPLTIVTNYNLYGIKYVNFKGKKIRLIEEIIAPDFDPNAPHINVSKFKIKKKKAILKFKYNGYSVFIQLKKNGNNWDYHKLKSHNKNNKDKVDIIF